MMKTYPQTCNALSKNLRVSSKELSDDLEAIQHNFLLRGFFSGKKNKE